MIFMSLVSPFCFMLSEVEALPRGNERFYAKRCLIGRGVDMRRTGILGLIFLLILSYAALSADQFERTLGLGGGVFAGMSGIKGDLSFCLPGMLNMDNFYLSIGLAYTDSKNLSPKQEWRKLLPLSLDGIFYLSENAYIGGGLNYPLIVSDNETPDNGSEIFLGAEFKMDPTKRIYAEVGYSIVRMVNKSPFKGASFILGLRHDIATPPIASIRDEVVKVPKEKLKKIKSEMKELEAEMRTVLEKIKTEIKELEIELWRVGKYVDLLGEKIDKVQKAESVKEDLEFRSLRDDEP